MTMRAMFMVTCLGLMATGASAQLVGGPLEDNNYAAPAGGESLKSLAESCPGHKFETIVNTGPGRTSRVKICGKPGQSEAEWLVTLRDSVRKAEADTDMALSVRNEIVIALKTEIAKVETSLAAKPSGIGDDGTTLAFNLPTEKIAPREPAPEYSTLPPLPAPKRSVPFKLSNGTVLPATEPLAPIVKPNLVIRCAIPRESFAVCSRLERESQLLVSAAADLPPGTSLRFMRGDDDRGELVVGQLRAGETKREKLPGRVCSGVLRGKVRVQVLNNGQVAETLGPWNLYCGS